MENLQEFQVRKVRGFGKAVADKTIKKFMKKLTAELIIEQDFADFFKKKLDFFSKQKKEKSIIHLKNEVLACKDCEEIAKTLCNQDFALFQKIFGFLVCSYLQWQEGFELNFFFKKKHAVLKKSFVKKLKKSVLNQKKNVALMGWGSFFLRKESINLFSDIDCVLLVNDDSLMKPNKMKNFLKKIFKELKAIHYNLPTKKELEWFASNKGVARCGLLKNGIFANFKIISLKALHYSANNFCAQCLKESNHGRFIIPDFDNKQSLFLKKNSLPVYPMIKSRKIYKPCRGLIPEALHTGKIILSKNKELKKELLKIKDLCTLKSMGIIKAQNPRLSEKKTALRILEISYTPIKEMKNKRKKGLLSYYLNLLKKNQNHFLINGFLIKLYGELALPLIEKSKNFWNQGNLIAFYLGAPLKNKKNTMKKKVAEYFKAVKRIQDEISPELMELFEKNMADFKKEALNLSLKKKEKILLAAALMDVSEKFCKKRSNFYSAHESLFEEMFPNEHKKALKVLNNLFSMIGGEKKAILFEKDLTKELKRNPLILGARMRIRQPAGLWQHSLMKNIPLNEIDDIFSIQMLHSSKDLRRIIKTVSEILKEKGHCFEKKILRIEQYKGHHFYFKIKSAPFEIMVRDLKSNVSIEHKISHSITQKRAQRLK
ncbi:MAG: hypothetical protein PHG04_00155 [Candidatus Nanoarchaeia archaeon]|nr:hypothetical protein [Candidatus Nanoarchaeia archaeon]MDD5053777.1 hypothetical protein [Candidatus Nanoarchaeia archaeon]